MYKVIKHFTDLKDKGYSYNVGDTFPHDGVTVSAMRIAELSSANNKQGTPLIELVGDKSKVKEEVPLAEAEPASTPTESEVEAVAEEKPVSRRGRKKK